MTALAHKILGNVVPNVSGLVQITDSPHEHGLLLDRQPGTPLVELWSTLSPMDQATVLKSLVDLLVTGLLDWELANIAPAYFEYVAARLGGGHDPPWRKVLLEVLRQVLRIECDRAVGRTDTKQDLAVSRSEDLFMGSMAAWNSLVDVERFAQGYTDDCYWTFEEAA
ncbi:hypothetical protein D6C90_01283 [Aureobasidium pullulans]|uniref:Uncharacterized protein n=1 Tax=Aureobasidium pullulans TaxID=5580 RepID=A0A4S9DYD4_AURPU|nr:hypothetical protein D6D12_06813 [Aureobasidium pullulans]THX65721.1 hypothetical protein D6D11_00234 [Aureobasidium pullulans]THX76059.1 hypothetical protein D6D04_07023 [Aureobasidium pullulans]THX77590.1 hypothetical protein D6D08_05080 [Aureobasidium pullulans]THZ52240.1 hypothetical protein D6C90_01283 [Aureobasidium pullulans]